MTAAGSITARSSGLEVVESGREQSLDRRWDGHVIDVLGRPPGAILEGDEALVDEHGQQLLDE